MAGYLLMEGGAEFGDGMAQPDKRAIELAGGVDTPIGIHASLDPTQGVKVWWFGFAKHHNFTRRATQWREGIFPSFPQ